MKRIMIYLLVGMLIVFQPIKAYADAGTVSIVGGSIATGGLSVAALGALSGPAVVIVFTALIAAGMNVRLTQASQEAGMTKTQFIKSKIDQFCSEANITLGVFTKAILEDTSIAKNGLISLGSNARKQIVQFGNWLFESDQVEDPTSASTSGDTITLGGYTMPLTNTLTVIAQSGRQFTFTASKPVAWFLGRYTSNDRINVCCVCNTSFEVNVVPTYGTTTANAVHTRGQDFYGISWEHFYDNQGYNPGLTYVNGQWQEFIHSLDGVWNPGMAPTDDTMTGKETDWTQNKDRILDPSTYLNPGLNPGLDIPQDKSISVSIPDYLDAIGSILDGTRNPAIPGIDDSTDMPVDVPYDDTVDPDPAIEDPEVDPGPTDPVINPDEPATGDLAVEPFKLDIKSLFPFCIPFDVVDMLKMLKTDPVAPSYNVNWNIPIINQTLSFTVDLSPFNQVASILRTMEIIAFCIGLAFVTRSMFIRG